MKLLANFVAAGAVGWCIAGLQKAVRDKDLNARQKYAVILVIALGVLGLLWL